MNTDKSVVLFVEFHFEMKNMKLAIKLLREMQEHTLANEEGCLSYEMLVNEEKPNTIFLYESYKNESALETHNNASYFKKIVGGSLSPIIKDQQILKLNSF